MSENTAKPSATPGARWREEGSADPHGTSYDCERAKLPMGELTDDEMANAVFMHGNEVPDFQKVLSGEARMPIAYLTAAKERIRWLSRKLHEAQSAPQAGVAADGVVVSRALLESLWESNTKARNYWEACERAGADVDAAAAELEAAMATAEWHCGQFNANGGLAQADSPHLVVDACGGCGEVDENKRCIGCMHPFAMVPAEHQPSPPPPAQPEAKTKTKTKTKTCDKCVITRARLNGILADAVRAKSALKASEQRIQELRTENRQLRARAPASGTEN